MMNYFVISGKPHLFGHRDDIKNFLNLMSQYNRGYNTFDRWMTFSTNFLMCAHGNYSLAIIYYRYTRALASGLNCGNPESPKMDVKSSLGKKIADFK